MASGKIPPNLWGVQRSADTHNVAKTIKKVAAIGVAIATIVAIGAVLAAFLVPGGGMVFTAIAAGAGVEALALLLVFYKQLGSERESMDKINAQIEGLPGSEWEKVEAKDVRKLAPYLSDSKLNDLVEMFEKKISNIETEARENPQISSQLDEIIKMPVMKNRVDDGYKIQRELIKADNIFYKLCDLSANRQKLTMDSVEFKNPLFESLSVESQYRYEHRTVLAESREAQKVSSLDYIDLSFEE